MTRLGLFILTLCGGFALGNGGGYFRGGLEAAGDVKGFEPEETEKVRIVDELLTVRLGADEAAVEVRYRMENISDSTAKVRFGFPVEESLDSDPAVPSGETRQPGAESDNELKYCQDYRITADGEVLKKRWQGERRPTGDRRFESIAGWLISELKFAKGQRREVVIGFTSEYPRSERYVSDDSFTGPGLFKYRLSTAAVWAGTIGAGRIELIPDGIDPAELRVIAPVNRFEREGDRWVWEFEDLEPTMADDLVIEARPAAKTYWRRSGEEPGDWQVFTKRGENWSIAHRNYQVTASSTHPPDGEVDHAAENVKSLEDNAWCEGAEGPGIGEWLELKPAVAKPLVAVSLTPGYAKSDELFQVNARPRKMTIELNGGHRFQVDVADSRQEQRFPVLDYAGPVETVRLIFDEVWPGERFEDLCITNVSLESKTDSEPEITPAR